MKQYKIELIVMSELPLDEIIESFPDPIMLNKLSNTDVTGYETLKIFNIEGTDKL